MSGYISAVDHRNREHKSVEFGYLGTSLEGVDEANFETQFREEPATAVKRSGRGRAVKCKTRPSTSPERQVTVN